MRKILHFYSCNGGSSEVYYKKFVCNTTEGDVQRNNNRNNGNDPDGNSGFKMRWFFNCCFVVLALLAVISYAPQDINTITGGTQKQPENWIGPLGAYFSWHLLLWFGLGGYVLVVLLTLRAVRLLFPQPPPGRISTFFSGLLLVMAGVLLLFGLTPELFSSICANLNLGNMNEPQLSIPGGVIGQLLAAPPAGDIAPGLVRGIIGPVGTTVLALTLIAAGGATLYAADWHKLLFSGLLVSGAEAANNAGRSLGEWFEQQRQKRRNDDDEYADDDGDDDEPAAELFAEVSRKESKDKKPRKLSELFRNDDDIEDDEDDDLPLSAAAAVNQRPETVLPQDIPPRAPLSGSFVSENEAPPPPPAQNTSRTTPDVGTAVVRDGEKVRSGGDEFILPPISMLAQGTDVVGETSEAIEHARAALQNTLDSFGVPGKVTGYVSGPRVTRFEITLEPGVNVKKVEQLENNIAMSLAATSVRVLAPIPGRTVVGVEVSNSKPEAVFMRSVMESDAWRKSKAEIPIALGKDVSGEPVIMDLAKAPHMLVAGATGTGKSVCSNSLIISLLFRFKPDEMRLIMVDPKIVEFDAYKNLPHLLTPIINESAKVPIALRWAANEMDRRYRVLAKVGVKKLSEFNSRPVPQEPEFDDDGKEIPAKMPLLVIILDELADLMMTEAKKDVETNITRIAQKGRAAGIHIIVATQRPSTNIITGVIKANLPTRLCFQVRSRVDSQVVLDTPGADKLLGTGDMLFMSSTNMNIERIQGAWVKDDDIKSIVKFVSDQAPQRFNDNVLVDAESAEAEAIDDDYEAIDQEDLVDIAPLVKKYMQPGDDDTMRRALEVVILDRKASTSYLQRRLRIGYNRAAELVDTMEERGILGPPSGSGNKRDILIFDGIDIGE